MKCLRNYSDEKKLIKMSYFTAQSDEGFSG